MTSPESEQVSLQKLRALAEPGRLQMATLLLAGPLTVTELANHTALSAVNASRHLKILSQAGLVCRQKEGRNVVYSLDPRIAGVASIDLGFGRLRFEPGPVPVRSNAPHRAIQARSG
jgi:DNA-binding transcriptional ArsR family regulator